MDVGRAAERTQLCTQPSGTGASPGRSPGRQLGGSQGGSSVGTFTDPSANFLCFRSTVPPPLPSQKLGQRTLREGLGGTADWGC